MSPKSPRFRPAVVSAAPERSISPRWRGPPTLCAGKHLVLTGLGDASLTLLSEPAMSDPRTRAAVFCWYSSLIHVYIGSVQRKGFTLIELLVVIAIIAVVIAILLPTIVMARRKADDTVCAARLHDLVAATTIYLDTNNCYPLPRVLPALGGPLPMAISQELVNQLGTVMRWPTVDYTMNVQQLPLSVVCPLRLQVELFLDSSPPADFGEGFWNTGYGYFGGIAEVGGTTTTVLAPDEITGLRGRTRGVLWADNLYEYTVGGSPQGFAYWHWNGGHQQANGFIPVPNSLRGIHRAWSDGSVEWLPGKMLNLDPTQAETNAAYRVGPMGTAVIYFYF
jgi:prepilin-type N-terminal cleavage/methylation domain-containing protein